MTGTDNLTELDEKRYEHQLDDSQRDALSSLGYLFLQHKQAARAITLFTGLYRLEPGNWRYLASLAYACVQGEDFDRALSLVEPGIARGNADSHVLRLIAARALLGLNRHEEARQQLAQMSSRREGAY